MSLIDNLNVLGENKENYKFFSVPIKKEITNIDKDSNKIVEIISCKIKFIESMRIMPTSLWNHVDNATEGIHKI